jgi:hypothetical protein
MGESQADGESTARRSSSLFDPVAGMRAMADIQAEGFRAAAELIERMLRSEADAPGRRSPSAAAGDYAALVDAWTDLLRRTVSGLARPDGTGAVTVSVDSPGVGPQVRLALGGDENPAAAAAEVWLHNGSFGAVGPLALSCGQLNDADGAVLEGAEVSFEPAEVALLPARSSRAVTVSLESTGPLRPGTYRGTIQARGAPGLWLPFEVVVGPC